MTVNDRVRLLYIGGHLVGHINTEEDGYYLWLWWPEVRDRMGLYKTLDEALAVYHLIVAAAGGQPDEQV